MDRIAELELALSKAEAKVNEQKESVLRTQAEMENVRRRASQDVEKAHKFALEKFANELLTTVDNLNVHCKRRMAKKIWIKTFWKASN